MLGVEKPIDDTRKQLGEAWSTVQRSDSGFNLGRRAIGAGAISSLHSSSQTQSPIDSACEGRVGVHRNCVQQRFVATNPADDQPRHIENVVATHGIRGLAGQRISLNEHAGDGTIGALRNHEYGAEVGDGSDDEVQTILHSRASKGYTKLPTRPDGDDELPTMHVQSPSRVMGIGAEEAKDDGFPTVLLSKSASKVGPAPAGADTSGIRQIGHFTVLHEIAEGGMGVVYAALDEQLGRKVAIKLLTAKGDQAGQADERMIREARAMARLSHPNVVQVHEVGTFDGKTFVAMEYVEGLTLRKWLKQGLTWMEVLDVFRQAGQGLAAAHKQGIVHRDFKPENVVVSKDQRVKVLDFGLARWKTDGGEIPISSDESQSSFEIFLSESNDGRSLTQTGHVLGTPAYMSPEQFEGKTADGRSDQFGFCVALYEALYGHRPFRGRTYAKLARAITKGSPLLPPEDTDVPKWVHKVVMRGLSRDPDDRFPSMEALLTGFEDFKANVDAYNTEMLRLESGLGTIMVLAFWILDWMFVADHVYLALFIRLGIGGAALIIHMLCRRRQRFVERNIDNLSLAINILTGWGMCVIIWLAGGYESAYYAGLNLLVLSLGIMFLWTVRRALLLNGIIYGFYMLPLVFGIIEVHEPDVVLSNQFFLLSTMIIVMTAQRQRYAQERRRFLAEQERSQLREEVAALGRRRRGELYERTQFLLLAEDELQKSRREQREMWCMVIGVDGFHGIGAQHGEAVQTEILANLRQRLSEELWRFDLAGQYHGDELVFLVSNAEVEALQNITEQLIWTLSGKPISTQVGPLEITFSVGLASAHETGNLTTLLSRATAALEQARSEGGGHMMVSDDSDGG